MDTWWFGNCSGIDLPLCAIWLLSREIRRERENCCDDLAVSVGGNRVAYARTLVMLEAHRAPMPTTAVAASGGSLIDRIRRVVGQSAKTNSPRGTWLAGATVMLSVCVILPIAMAVGEGKPDGFDFSDIPAGYEKGVRMAERDHSIKAGGLRFKLSGITRASDGTLEANLGLKNGHEIVSIRLFDHATRELVHDSEWQLNLDNHPSTRTFNATRVGESNWHWLADAGLQRYLEGKRLAHYLAARGPKRPKPELKDNGLKWGPVVDGLQLAVELTPKGRAYLLGETIDVRFHLRNAADYAIQVGLTVPMEQDMREDSVFIRDKDGKRLEGKSTWYSGAVDTKQTTLQPGESAVYESSDLAFVAPGKQPGMGAVGYWVEAASGVYTVQFKQHFPTGFSSEPREWQGVLETAPVTVRIAEQPKFAIHRVRAYRRPGDSPGELSRRDAVQIAASRKDEAADTSEQIDQSRLLISKARHGQVLPDGISYSLDGKQIRFEQLQELLKANLNDSPNLHLLIVADKELPLSTIAVAIQAAEMAGIQDVEAKRAGDRVAKTREWSIVSDVRVEVPKKDDHPRHRRR